MGQKQRTEAIQIAYLSKILPKLLVQGQINPQRHITSYCFLFPSSLTHTHTQLFFLHADVLLDSNSGLVSFNL